MFLRTGWVVGNVGLAPSLGIVTLAHLNTIATSLSVSAVVTNMHRESSDADVVFMSLREPAPGAEAELVHRMEHLIGDLPTVILVRAAGPFAGQLI